MDAMELFNAFFVHGPNGPHMRLNDEEQHVAGMVFRVVYEEVKKRKDDFADDDDDICFNPKFQIVQEKVARIVKSFHDAQNSRSAFLTRFPKWNEERTVTVASLEELGDSIHLDRFNCNVSRLCGSFVSFLASLAAIASIAFPPAAPALIPAAVAAGLGSATTFGATLAEIALLKKKTGLAQEAVNKDQERFKGMQNWFENSIELANAIEAVLGFKVAQKLAEDLKDFVGKDITTCSAELSNRLRESLKKIFDFSDNKLFTLTTNVACMLITFFVVVILLHNRNCFIFDCAVVTIRIVFGLLSALDLGVDVTRTVAAAFMKGGAVAAEKLSENVLRAVFHGVFAGISSILDVVNIALTSIDIHYKSVSEQGVALKNAATLLKEQQDILQGIYDKLEHGINAA